jgi:hypothetical protein
MKVNGYMLRESIKQHNLELQVAKNIFNDSTTTFPKENKPSLAVVSARVYQLELAITELQTGLSQYNISNKIEVEGLGTVSLLKAIKLIGPMERMELLWRKLVAPKQDRYSRREVTTSRSATDEHVQNTFSVEEATEQTKTWAHRVTRLRAAIATMNATMINLELDAKLFE